MTLSKICRYLIFAFLIFNSSFLFSREQLGILDQFIRCLLIDSEAGFVFFGSKPASFIYCGEDLDTPFIGSSNHEQEVILRLGCQSWLSAKPQQINDDYILKISKLDGGVYEVLCLNKKEIINTISENLPLFQYVLGSKVKPELLFEQLARSNNSFYEILNHDNALAGILLGFGTTNSILGSRHEALILNEELVPNLPNCLGAYSKDELTAWQELISTVLFNRTLGPFSNRQQHLYPSFQFVSLIEEAQQFTNCGIIRSEKLENYSPKLFFRTYTSDSISKLKSYESEHRKIISMIQDNEIDLTDQVLKKLSIHSLKSPEFEVPKLEIADLVNSIRKRLGFWRFENQQGLLEGIQDSYLERPDRYANLDGDHFHLLWVLNHFQEKIHTVEKFQNNLKIDPTYTPLSAGVYFKILEFGSGDILDCDHSVAIFSYMISPAERFSSIPYEAKSYQKINLNEVIPGFAEGVQGMREGELREIQILPESGYGFFTTFEPWQPLKVLIRLDKIMLGLKKLKIQPKPLLPTRSLYLSSEESFQLKELEKILAYHKTKEFWNFFKKLGPFNEKQVAEWINTNWDKPIQFNTKALDVHCLKIWSEQQWQENKNSVENFVSDLTLLPIINEKLYIRVKEIGNGKKVWPRKITLRYKNHDDQLECTEYSFLTMDEFSCWNKGLQIGLKDRCIGDKGTLYIHPDLTDLSLFRNHMAHKKMIIHFEIQEP